MEERTGSPQHRSNANVDIIVVDLRESRRATTAAMMGCTLFGCTAVPICLIALSAMYLTPFPGLLVVPVLTWAGYGIVRELRKSQNAEFDAIAALASSDDVAAVGALVEEADRYASNPVSDALKRLLPRMNESDGAYLTQRQHDMLRNLLINTWDRDLTVTILKAYCRIGPPRAIWQVYSLAAGRIVYLATPEIMAAANTCLPILEARAAKDRAGRILLRPSNDPQSRESILLRSAGNLRQEDPQRLVRPATGLNRPSSQV